MRQFEFLTKRRRLLRIMDKGILPTSTKERDNVGMREVS
jgi:hypothetical protein